MKIGISLSVSELKAGGDSVVTDGSILAEDGASLTTEGGDSLVI